MWCRSYYVCKFDPQSRVYLKKLAQTNGGLTAWFQKRRYAYYMDPPIQTLVAFAAVLRSSSIAAQATSNTMLYHECIA